MKHQWPIIQLQSVDSTNNYAIRLLSDNEADTETVISACYQTHGRGQEGNSWVSENLMNVTFSIILKTNYLKADQQFRLSQAISLGITDLLFKHHVSAKVKWPNDIFVDDAKICGLLIEHTVMGSFLAHSVVGIGFNANQTNFAGVSTKAVSLAGLTHKTYDTDMLQNELLDCIHVRIEQLKNRHTGLIHAQYLEHLYLYQQMAVYEDADGQFNGNIIDIEPTGTIVIEKENHAVSTYLFKEVNLICNTILTK